MLSPTTPSLRSVSRFSAIYELWEALTESGPESDGPEIIGQALTDHDGVPMTART